MEGKQISTKQFVCVQFLIAIAIKMFLLPALMLRVVGKDSAIVMAIWIAVEFVNLGFILFIACRNPDKTMYDMLLDAFGKVGSRIAVGIISLFALAKSVLILSEIKMFFSVTLFDEINWKIMIIPILVLMTAFSLRSLRSFGRVAEIITPFVIIGALALAYLIADDFTAKNLLPVLSDGFAPVAEGLVTFPMWFGDITFLVMFLGNIKINRGFIIGSLVTKFVATAFVMLFSCTLFSTYANISTLIDYGHNLSNMTQFSFGAQTYGRFDLLFYCVWLLSVFLKLAAVFYFLTRNVGFIVRSRNNYVTGISCAAILYVLGEFVLSNENVVYAFFTGAVKYVTFPAAIILPLALLVICLIKYRPNYRKKDKKERKEERKNEHSNAKKQSAPY